MVNQPSGGALMFPWDLFPAEGEMGLDKGQLTGVSCAWRPAKKVTTARPVRMANLVLLIYLHDDLELRFCVATKKIGPKN